MKTKIIESCEKVAKSIRKPRIKANLKIYVGGLITAAGMTTMLMAARDEGVCDASDGVNNILKDSYKEEEENTEDSTETSGD